MPKKTATLSLRLREDTKNRLKKVAKARGDVTPNALAEKYLRAGIQRDERKWGSKV